MVFFGYILMFDSTAHLQYKNVSFKAGGREHFAEIFCKIAKEWKNADNVNVKIDDPAVGMCVRITISL